MIGFSKGRRWPTAVLALAMSLVISRGSVRMTDAATMVSHKMIFGRPSRLQHEITPQVRRAIARGLKWLATRQHTNGSFGQQSMVAVSALGGLAFVAGGNLPGQGRYGHNTAQALRYVLSQCQPSGLIASATDGAPMYGQGFATLFLAEVYGESHQPQLRQKLQRAVRLIIETQNAQGGWRYQPMPMPADISVTICQVMALRAARQAGIAVPHRTIKKAIAFVRQLQNPDGSFDYMPGMPFDPVPQTAAAVALLFYAGVYHGKAVTAGVQYLNHDVPGAPTNNPAYFFYGNYYGTQAMFLAGGRWWSKWCPAIQKTLLARQNSNGSWQATPGQSYGTAMALIILQIPDRLLPILQK